MGWKQQLASLRGTSWRHDRDLARHQFRAELDQILAERDRALMGFLTERFPTKEIKEELVNIHQMLNLVRRENSNSVRTIRVIFVVQYIESWPDIEGIYRAMTAADDFEAFVITAGDDSFRTGKFQGEDLIHEFLQRAKIPHLRLESEDAPHGTTLIRHLAPDVIFRQTLHEFTIPFALRLPNISLARLCYIPYGVDIVDVPDVFVNQEFLWECWRIFCLSDLHQRFFKVHSKIGAVNTVVTGHPKFDYLLAMRGSLGEWPITGSERKFRILWAPHHSVTPDWLRFGTFVETYREILEWAGRDNSVEIVLRPHPCTFTKLVTSERMSQLELDEFLAAWKSLPNTGIDEQADFAFTFAASDALLTDGISFLAEYQVMDKPLVFLDSRVHEKFTELGERVAQGAYNVSSAAEAITLLGRIQDERFDPLRDERRAVLRDLMPFPGQSATHILDEIRTALPAGVTAQGMR